MTARVHGARTWLACALLSLVAVACGSTLSPPDGGAGGATGGGAGGTTGGGGQGGQGGATGGGGAAGAACVAATSVDRSCSVLADCVAVLHHTNCCGGQAWLGIRASEEARFGALEAMCVQSFPACGCFDGSISADDGSQIASGTIPPVACVGGSCRTYAAGCGQPCPTGTSCKPCSNGVGVMVPSCVDSCPIVP